MGSAEIINNVMEALGTNATSLSKATGIHRQVIYNIQQGKNEITKNVANKICERFPQVSMPYLLTGEGNMFVGGGVPAEGYDVSDIIDQLKRQNDEIAELRRLLLHVIGRAEVGKKD